MPQAARLVSPAYVRTVYVNVMPAPVSLSERRAVLRALKQHGDIEVFQKLSGPSSFMSIPASQTTAFTLIGASPLQFDYVPAAAPAAGILETPPGPSKTFTVRIKEEPDFKHKTHLRERAIYGPWLEQDGLFQQTSPARAALRRVVPRDGAWRGLADWETNDQGREEESLSRWTFTARGGQPMSSLIRKRNRFTFRSSLLHGERRPDPDATEEDDGEA